ncbi:MULTISPECIES: hypothetical protein [unclassified Thiomonas]|jgi:hypothetical protein|uniref:hypothetical protein n=1 Tax=unclassified Thiomonas TaxID=2625466 RepID=UPI0004DB9E40|nr:MULTISPECIES: hypothetical protein [unclassified Thiomonas]CQR42869.1 conserved exported hypothetical protein [Thiomonas sp. CB3]CDW93482.1 conserved exported hypothetical protein [Thiomonas sp. CB2]VDY05110.1 conserved protein of unknown function [Thiomonas sp. Bio17B3]VDY07725.1 conserved protein of unknown function [Thiomonas sp. Sup16B3]VDY13356.1 hypothetical protein; putative exported protein [Thiomonas sp. OC7]
MATIILESTVQQSRRLFIQKTILTLPAIGTLASCGGGASSSGPTALSTGAQASPNNVQPVASGGNTMPPVMPTTTASSAQQTQTAPSSTAPSQTAPATSPPAASSQSQPTSTASSAPTTSPASQQTQPTQTTTTSAQPSEPASSPTQATQQVASGTDLSAGLKQFGQTPIPYSKLTKPAKGQTIKDPDTGLQITRITDCVKDFNNLCVAPAYPTAMAWNCDETRFILYVPGSTAQAGGQQGWAMYDGTTYAFIKFLDINPGDVEQFYWDHADPATLRYIDNHSVGSQNLADLTAINVETGAKTIIHSFLPNGLPPGCPSGTQGVRCGYPFALGVNAQGQRIWGLGAFGTNVPNVSGELGMWVFGFNEATGAFTLYDQSIVPQPQARGSTPFPSVSGKFFIWNAAVGLNSQPTTQSAVLDAATGKLVRWVNFDTNEHCDTAMDASGNDLLVGSQFSRNTGGNGNVIVCNLNTGAVSNDVGESSGWGYPTTGSLSGSTAWKNPSWVVTGMTGNIYGTGSNGVASPGSNGNSGPTANPCTILDQELMITNLTSGVTWRLAHHRSTGNWSNASQSNYWAQPNVTFSTSGTRILFNSDWGDGDPSNPVVNPNAAVDTYVLILPSYA